MPAILGWSIRCSSCTHAHGDHIAGDAQFAQRAETRILRLDLDEVAFYGFHDWFTTSRPLDLGGRAIDVIPGPGHEASQWFSTTAMPVCC
ncbi:MBL fold metallo-hydrolase [Amycolatopsis taiwanensis]|uniref:MBL fold metallo-hydrolase n=1 Tax=Amycolatopsis taiwanensis TaxID=342230 RepID=UPI003D7F45AF